jgi:lysozyme family protein
MTDAFLRELDKLFPIEGGFSNHASDRGGRTNLGITERVARAAGYTGPMETLPRHIAVAIYKSEYWDRLSLDRISGSSLVVASELFDTGVNMGIGRASEFFQRALNALNKKGEFFSDIKVDNVIGPVTCAAFEQYMSRRRAQDGERVMLAALNSLQGAFYVSLAERDASQEDFVFGWLRQRVYIPAKGD